MEKEEPDLLSVAQWGPRSPITTFASLNLLSSVALWDDLLARDGVARGKAGTGSWQEW